MSEVFSTGNPPEERKLPAAERIEEIAKAPVVAQWLTDIPDKQYWVGLTLPHGCSLSATVVPENGGWVKVDMFSVPDEFQGNGIGSRLMKTLVAEVRRFGIGRLTGHVTSQSALKTRARIFGPENLVFYQRLYGGKGARLDISYEQALVGVDAETSDGYYVDADLTAIQSGAWELPTQMVESESE